MNITCPHCRIKLNLPDDKISKLKDAAFKCPKCKKSIQVKSGPRPWPEPGGLSLGEGQFRRATRSQALVCMPSSQARMRLASAIRRIGYFVDMPENSDQALETMAYNVFPLVVLDDAFDGDGRMVRYMNEMDMSQRRKICLVWISPGVETGNAMAALHASANFVVRSQDLAQEDTIFIEDIIGRALEDHKNFYAVFNDSLVAVGKA